MCFAVTRNKSDIELILLRYRHVKCSSESFICLCFITLLFSDVRYITLIYLIFLQQRNCAPV